MVWCEAKKTGGKHAKNKSKKRSKGKKTKSKSKNKTGEPDPEEELKAKHRELLKDAKKANVKQQRLKVCHELVI